MRGFSTKWKAALLAGAIAMPVTVIAQNAQQPPADGPKTEHARGMRHRHGHGHGPGPGGFARMLERNAERLKLDESTLEQIRGLGTDARNGSKDLIERQKKEREVMRTLLDAQSTDESAILSQADLLGQIDTDLRKQDLRTMLAMRRLLTPEQRAELKKLREERPHGPGGKHGRRGPRPGPEQAPE
jgi:Spy/CpxP family protein refolding chaperone